MDRRTFLQAAAALIASLVLDQRAPAQPGAESQVLEFEHVPSAALGRDLVYSLYLPPGYAAGERRYPILYLLHGKNGNHLEWLKSGHLRETLDKMIAGGRVDPMIVAMPDGGADSWYVDSKAVGGPGDYATAIGDDLVAALDRRLRTRPEPRFRGIGGLSMGGFGALRLAFAQPFRYAAAAAFSGAFWSQLSPDNVPAARVNRVFGGAFGTPFDIKRFLAEAPTAMLDEVAKAKDPPAVFLTVGDRDRYRLYDESFALFERMRALGLPVKMRMTGGDHEWATWAEELPDALLFFDQQFKSDEARDPG